MFNLAVIDIQVVTKYQSNDYKAILYRSYTLGFRGSKSEAFYYEFEICLYLY